MTSVGIWAAASFGTSCGSTGPCDTATSSGRCWAPTAKSPLDENLDNIVQAKYVTQKYSYQANSAHRFIFFNLWEHLRENAKMDSQRSWEAREDKATAHPIFKWGWEGQFGNAIAANFQFGYAPHDSVAPFLNTGTPQEIGRENVDTGIIHGENVVSGEDSRHFLHQTKGAVTYYKSNWAGGNHEFKVGGEYARNKNFRSLSGKPVNYHLLYEGEEAGPSGSVAPSRSPSSTPTSFPTAARTRRASSGATAGRSDGG